MRYLIQRIHDTLRRNIQPQRPQFRIVILVRVYYAVCLAAYSFLPFQTVFLLLKFFHIQQLIFQDMIRADDQRF